MVELQRVLPCPCDSPAASMTAIHDSDQIFTKEKVFHTLEVLDDACTTFRSEHVFSIRAELRSRFYNRRFQWTGSDDDEEPILQTTYDKWGYPLHRIHGPIIREGPWRIVVVDLGRTLEIGEEDILHFHHRLRDLNGKFEPYLSHAPQPGTKNIILHVILPKSLAHDVVFDDRMLDTDKVIDSEGLTGEPLDAARMLFAKEVPNPAQLNRVYRIRWKHPLR